MLDFSTVPPEQMHVSILRIYCSTRGITEIIPMELGLPITWIWFLGACRGPAGDIGWHSNKYHVFRVIVTISPAGKGVSHRCPAFQSIWMQLSMIALLLSYFTIAVLFFHPVKGISYCLHSQPCCLIQFLVLLNRCICVYNDLVENLFTEHQILYWAATS